MKINDREIIIFRIITCINRYFLNHFFFLLRQKEISKILEKFKNQNVTIYLLVNTGYDRCESDVQLYQK